MRDLRFTGKSEMRSADRHGRDPSPLYAEQAVKLTRINVFMLMDQGLGGWPA
jgi:hypothetical protein